MATISYLAPSWIYANTKFVSLGLTVNRHIYCVQKVHFRRIDNCYIYVIMYTYLQDIVT